MHVIVGVFKMDPERRAEQAVALHERTIPGLRQTPGFVSSTSSYDPATSRSHCHIVFDTAHDARRYAAFLRGEGHRDPERHGGEIESLIVAEVVAQVLAQGMADVRRT